MTERVRVVDDPYIRGDRRRWRQMTLPLTSSVSTSSPTWGPPSFRHYRQSTASEHSEIPCPAPTSCAQCLAPPRKTHHHPVHKQLGFSFHSNDGKSTRQLWRTPEKKCPRYSVKLISPRPRKVAKQSHHRSGGTTSG